MVAPQPAHHLRKNRSSHFLAVLVHAPGIVQVVSFFAECLHHAHVLVKPVPCLIVGTIGIQCAIVIAAIAQKNADRFLLALPNDVRIAFPPRISVTLPTLLSTLRNSLGRSQATVNAAIAPELEPPMPWRSGSCEMLYCLYTTGNNSSTMTRAYLSSSVLYSVGRLVVWSPHSLAFGSG